MGLGQALTGFLTGFSERAAENISTRNKEIRDSIDEDLKKHAASVQADYAKKIKLRKQAYEHVSFLEANATEIPAFKNLSIQEKATLVTNEELMKRLKDLAKSEDGRKAINLRFAGTKKNNKPDHNSKVQTIEQAIDLRIPVEAAMPAPRVTRTTGAYGLTNTIEEDAIRRYAQQNPEYYSRPTVKPKTSVQMDDILLPSTKPTDIRKNVKDTVETALKFGIAGDPGKYQYAPPKDINSFGSIKPKGTTALDSNQALQLQKTLQLEAIQSYLGNQTSIQPLVKSEILPYIPKEIRKQFQKENDYDKFMDLLDENVGMFRNSISKNIEQKQDNVLESGPSSLSQKEAQALYNEIASADPKDYPKYYNHDGTQSAKFLILKKREGY